MKLRGVLLDLDGTLVDHESAAAAGLRSWLPTLGIEATDDALGRWSALQEPHLAAWRAGSISYAEQRRRRLRDFLGADLPNDELDAIFGTYLPHYEAAWQAYEDVAEALALIAAAGLVTAVLTNGTIVQQNRKLARTGLAGRVGPVFTVEDVNAAKPNADAFLRSCELWGLEPGEVLSIGDNYDLDVLGARAAGLRAAHLDRLGVGPHDEPHRMTTLPGVAAFLL